MEHSDQSVQCKSDKQSIVNMHFLVGLIFSLIVTDKVSSRVLNTYLWFSYKIVNVNFYV